MTYNIYDLVRRDLLHRESEDIQLHGGPRQPYTGSEALLDAYDSAIDQCIYLRTVIEQMSLGDGKFDKPEHRAARSKEPEESCPFDCGPCHAHEDEVAAQ